MAVALIASILDASLLNAQEEQQTSPEGSAAVEHLWNSVQTYEVAIEAKDERCRLVEAPVLRWNNPVSGIKDGLVVMWVGATGRPAAAAQVFKTRTGYGLHEFQSLSEHPLNVRQATETLWHPDRGGIAFAPLPGSTPASSRAGRLVQMRKLAQQFDAAVRFKDNQGDESTTRYELRLLRQPIYRYQTGEATHRDGAVFAFVQGTNPEALLILEADKTETGTRLWKYALAPMTAYEVTVEHDVVGTWHARNRQARAKVPTEPFFITHFEKPPRD